MYLPSQWAKDMSFLVDSKEGWNGETHMPSMTLPVATLWMRYQKCWWSAVWECACALCMCLGIYACDQFKDTLKTTLKDFNIDYVNWEAQNQDVWPNAVKQRDKGYEIKRIKDAEKRREKTRM